MDLFTVEGVKWALQRAEQAVQTRSPEDWLLQRLASVFVPDRAHFTATRSAGHDPYRRIFDSAPQEAVENLSAGLFGTMMNPANRWFNLREPRRLRGDDNLKRYMAEATEWARESLTPAYSDFYAETPVLLTDVGALGTGVFLSGEWRRDKDRFLDKAVALHGVWIAADVDGQIRTHFCKRELTIAQIKREYPDAVPSLPRHMREAKDETQRHGVWLICMPNPKIRAYAGTAAERRYVALHVLAAKDEAGNPIVLRRVGEDTSAFTTARWKRNAVSEYGHGRGHVALGDALSLQVARKNLLEASAWAARPPILAPEERHFRTARVQPAGVIYGGMNRAGRQMVTALDTGTRMPFASEMTEQLRDAVRDSFFFRVLQIVGRSGMSATEVAEWSEQKWRLMGPAIGNLQAELLTPILQRRWHVLRREGMLPPGMPEEINRADFTPDVDFVSPMAMAQRSADGVAALRFVEGVKGLAEFAPDALDKLDVDAIVDEMQETFGARPYLVADDAVVRDKRQARAAQQNAQAAAEAAPGVAKAMKDLSDAAANDDGAGGLAGLGASAG